MPLLSTSALPFEVSAVVAGAACAKATVVQIANSETANAVDTNPRMSLPLCCLSPCPRQRMHPTLHAFLGVGDVLHGKEILRFHFVDGIDWPQEVALIAKWNGGIDAHAALELGVRGCPL